MRNYEAPDHVPRLAVYAGVFDPPTMAHLEIIESALRIFDELVVVVGFNPNKAGALFSPEERVRMLDASIPDDARARVRVTAYHGLIAPYAVSLGACALVRETATLGGMIVPGSVPGPVEEALRERFGQ